MEERIGVIAADTNFFMEEILSEGIETNSNIHLIGVASTGTAALDLVLSKKPDVLVLDIVLAEKDGIWVLEELNKRGIKDIGIIVVSTLHIERLIKYAYKLGASYFMAKPLSAEVLIRRIQQVYDMKEAERGNEHFEGVRSFGYTEIEDRRSNDNLEIIVTKILNKIGVSPSLKGYQYLKASIMLVANGYEISGITKNLYPDIAKEYSTSASKVERSIRHAIESSWKKNNGRPYSELFGGIIERKPTNGQTIASLAEYVKLKRVK